MLIASHDRLLVPRLQGNGSFVPISLDRARQGREKEREREALVSVVDASRKKVYLPFTSRLGTVQAEFAIHRHCNCPVKRGNESSMGDGRWFGFRDKDRDMFPEQRVKWQGIRRRVRLFRITLGLSLG